MVHVHVHLLRCGNYAGHNLGIFGAAHIVKYSQNNFYPQQTTNKNNLYSKCVLYTREGDMMMAALYYYSSTAVDSLSSVRQRGGHS